jgi:hypothetical protein|tara:strand:- start:76 stop:1353 length:1278 start_codon:yes stop_codon:yes gene_type:complete
MSRHTLEYQPLKKEAISRILNTMLENIEKKKKGIKISSSQLPKMYLRMARVLAGSEDETFGDIVDNLLTKNATGDEFKNALRGISERQIPQKYKRLYTDRLHHVIPLELMDVLVQQEPNVMFEFLQRAEADGQFFSDSPENLESFQEQAHTGAKEKKGGKNYKPDSMLNRGGVRELSAHPYGTNKGIDPSLKKQYASGVEMYEAFLPSMNAAKSEAQLGIRSDLSRRRVANDILSELGIQKLGDDHWAPGKPTPEIQVGRDALAIERNADRVADSFDPYKFQEPETLKKLGIKPNLSQALSLNRKQLQMLAAAGLAAPSMLGTAASAAETKGRAELALKTKNPIDAVQTGLSAASLAGDFVPVAGELISTPADTANLVIDGVRDRGGAKIQRSLARSKELQVSGRDDAATRKNRLSIGFSQNSGF